MASGGGDSSEAEAAVAVAVAVVVLLLVLLLVLGWNPSIKRRDDFMWWDSDLADDIRDSAVDIIMIRISDNIWCIEMIYDDMMMCDDDDDDDDDDDNEENEKEKEGCVM